MILEWKAARSCNRDDRLDDFVLEAVSIPVCGLEQRNCTVDKHTDYVTAWCLRTWTHMLLHSGILRPQDGQQVSSLGKDCVPTWLAER